MEAISSASSGRQTREPLAPGYALVSIRPGTTDGKIDVWRMRIRSVMPDAPTNGARSQSGARPAGLADGRWLEDFAPLSAAEQQLVEACATGEWCRFGEAPPREANPALVIRAVLLRFLLLGGDELHRSTRPAFSWRALGSRALSGCRIARSITVSTFFIAGSTGRYTRSMRACDRLI